MDPASCCVLNGGGGAWAFEGLARQLAAALWIDIAPQPRRYNYLLSVEGHDPADCGRLFIPYAAIELASDKRLLATAFATHEVPSPESWVMDTPDGAFALCRARPDREWCLKYPTGCGASGHRMLTDGMRLPPLWPRPLLVQEFIRTEPPEVYRTYGAGGRLFGWVVRRFPPGAPSSPWVAHARGARYEAAGPAPEAALAVARAALAAAGLLESFGCVDLLRRPSGEWLALEVGTDGVFNHVDRDLNHSELEAEIERRIAEAFWAPVGPPPWAPGPWRRRPA